ncbi:hypothetical protein H8959_013245 [Pygathrix nigripes]
MHKWLVGSSGCHSPKNVCGGVPKDTRTSLAGPETEARSPEAAAERDFGPAATHHDIEAGPRDTRTEAPGQHHLLHLRRETSL